MTGWVMLLITLVLVLLGCGLYVNDSIGWAQGVWVMASGTAGAGVAVLLDKRQQ